MPFARAAAVILLLRLQLTRNVIDSRVVSDCLTAYRSRAYRMPLAEVSRACKLYVGVLLARCDSLCSTRTELLYVCVQDESELDVRSR